MERANIQRRSSVSKSTPSSPAEIYHRSPPIVRSGSVSMLSSVPTNLHASPRLTPLLPSVMVNSYSNNGSVIGPTTGAVQENVPSIFGLPLKYVSLVTLAVQNAALSIVMHYSRVYTPPSLSYSPASAVLLNEILKGSISFMIALMRVREVPDAPPGRKPFFGGIQSYRFQQVCLEVFSPDCWKLSIPAILYVVQNSLQFVAVSNLPVASFQVSYQMKILTTAAFSVALLRKRLGSTKWLSLFFLAIGVAIVQLSTAAPAPPILKDMAVGSAHDSAPHHLHEMSPLTGFAAVVAACFTSGLAGVYFEMVLKNSKADLWVRNVQLSLFSLVPALLPVIYARRPPNSHGFLIDIFRNFGGWAWATVAIQVFGGLITAVVIKYSDNILKGFATSLSIILSFLASVALFAFRITPSFIIGASMVLVATWMYNQPSLGKEPPVTPANGSGGKSSVSFPGPPVKSDSVILGQFPRKKPSSFGNPRAIASALGLGNPESITTAESNSSGYFSATVGTPKYLESPYGSPYPSRTPSPLMTPMGSSNGSSDGRRRVQ